MTSSKEEKFVNFVQETIHGKNDKGFAAKLKKADNESTEYLSWEILAPWVDLEQKSKRRSYALIGASLACSRRKADGSLGLGRALLMTVEDRAKRSEAPTAARLRRILASQDTLELIGILRPNLRYLHAKEVAFSHSQLLNELLWYNNETSRERTRSKWAAEFFGSPENSP